MSARMTDLFEVCRETARIAVRRAGWDPKYDLEIEVGGAKDPFGPTQYHGRGMVRLVLSPDLPQRLEKYRPLRRPSGKMCVIEDLRNMVAAACYHQVGTFCVCPYSAYDYGEIVRAAADGLRIAGASERQIRDYTLPVAGLFVASVVGGVYAVEGPDPETFRRGTLIACCYESDTTEQAMSAALAVWTEIQLRLWGSDPEQCRIVRCHYPPEATFIDFDAARGIAILLDTFDYADRSKDSGLVWDSNLTAKAVIEELKYRHRVYSIKAFQFGELFFRHFTSQETGEPPASDSPQLPPATPGERPSIGAQTRWDAIRGQPLDLSTLLDSTAPTFGIGLTADSFAARLSLDTTFRQQVLSGAVNVGLGVGRRTPVPGVEVLEALYRQRTASVTMPTHGARRAGLRMPVAHLTRQPLGDELPSLNQIDWGATLVRYDSSLELFKKTLPITHSTPVKRDLDGIPDVCWCVDSSGSMSWDWQGGAGPYDCLLRSIFSVERYLISIGQAHFIRYCAVNFSGLTLRVPWSSFSDIRRVHASLFQHQGGGTKLDCSVLDQVARENHDRFLCIMVSDGMISNVDEIARTVRLLTERGVYFVFIQIGNPNKLTEHLTRQCVAVHIVKQPIELEGLCLEYASKTFAAQAATDRSKGGNL